MKKTAKKILCIVLCLAMLATTGIITVFATDDGAAVTRITCTVKGDTKSERGFCWYTAENTESRVKIFENGRDVSSSLTFEYEDVIEWEGSYMHKATVYGLEAGKSYTYLVGNGSVWGTEGKFTTDDGDDKVSFISIADVQASSVENFRRASLVVDAAFKTLPNADFLVNLGDFTNDSTNEEWDGYFSQFERHNTATSLAPIAGNHDGLGVWHWFDNMFNLDKSESVQNLNGINYSFDYGNAHFAVLNTNDLLSMSDAQLNWLRNDMNSTSADWKIAFMHKSPYTLGKDGKWPDALYLQQSLTKVLDDCGVDLVMSGHDHMYLRTKSLTNNTVVDDGEGVAYVLAGTAGTKRYQIREFSVNTYMKKDFIAAMTVQRNGYANYWNGEDYNSTDPANVGGCFSTVSIDGGNLTLNAYVLSDETQTLKKIDSFSLSKDTGKNVPTFEGDNSTSILDYGMNIVPSFLNLAKYAIFNWLVRTIIYLPKIIYYIIKDGTF